MDTFLDLAKALQNGDVQAINQAGNTISAMTGDPAPTDLSTAAQILTKEINRAFLGVAGGQSERDKMLGMLNAKMSPAQFANTVKTLQTLMVGQLKSSKLNYEATTKRTDFANRLSPRAQQILSDTEARQNTSSTTPTAANTAGKIRVYNPTTGRLE